MSKRGWKKEYTQREIENSSFDDAFRINKIATYGWDGAAMVQLSVDSNGYLNVNPQPLGTVGNGQNTVASAGTAEILGSSTAIESVTIKALSGNTGNIFVGDSGVSSSNGFILSAGDTVSLDIDNLADVYIDATTTGEGVSFIYLT